MIALSDSFVDLLTFFVFICLFWTILDYFGDRSIYSSTKRSCQLILRAQLFICRASAGGFMSYLTIYIYIYICCDF